MQETRVWSLDQEDPLEKEIATCSSILAWEIPWAEEPGRLQSMGSQRVRHNFVTKQQHTNLGVGGHIQLLRGKEGGSMGETSQTTSLRPDIWFLCSITLLTLLLPTRKIRLVGWKLINLNLTVSRLLRAVAVDSVSTEVKRLGFGLRHALILCLYFFFNLNLFILIGR